MGRSTGKGPYIAYHLLDKVNLMNEKGKKDTIKTWSRASTILPTGPIRSIFFNFIIFCFQNNI